MDHAQATVFAGLMDETIGRRIRIVEQDCQRAMAHQNHVAKHTLSTLFAITRILAVA